MRNDISKEEMADRERLRNAAILNNGFIIYCRSMRAYMPETMFGAIGTSVNLPINFVGFINPDLTKVRCANDLN